ncbi:DUF3139 domain-containing protein [Rossellomorea oryzaecorticis]|uniref:DUF3139 domain-containing protein n=1 Tax=Rossellomorea oryzaecorticis TaxID=1396505 RepID=A0ABU9K5K5_9BACI
MLNIFKSRKVFLIVIASGILIFTYFSYTAYANTGEKGRYDVTLRYLTAEKEYAEHDISNIEVSHYLSNVVLSYEPWSIAVVFKDEPNAVYYYDYNNGVISQGGISGYTENEIYKHFEGNGEGLDKQR